MIKTNLTIPRTSKSIKPFRLQRATKKHTYIHIYIHTYIQTYIQTNVHTYIHTNKQTYIHTYKQTYIHTYKQTYIHTYIFKGYFIWSSVNSINKTLN